MSEVFISYSRRDREFVQRLHDALAAAGRDAWVDWHDIPPTAEWWQEVKAGIEGADTFVFVISPDSAASEVCQDEISYAAQNGKRIVPLVLRDAGSEIHDDIGKINWIFMREQDDFSAAFELLTTAIDTDLEQVRTHTRLTVRAREWDNETRNPAYLLRGADLRDAENWLTRYESESSPSSQPQPSNLQITYIVSSRQHANRNQRSVLAGISTALVIVTILAILALSFYRESEDRRQESDLRGTGVADQASTATSALGVAQVRGTELANQTTAVYENLREARRIQSLFWSDLSAQQLQEGDQQEALALALEALQYYESDGIWSLDSVGALVGALNASYQETVYLAHPDYVEGAAWSRDETQVLSWAGDSVYVWDAATGEQRLRLPHGSTVKRAAWNAAETHILGWDDHDAVSVWDAATGEAVTGFTHPESFDGIWALWSADGQQVLSWAYNNWTSESSLVLWDVAANAEVHSLLYPAYFKTVQWSPDNTLILVRGWSELLLVDAQSGEIVREYQNDPEEPDIDGIFWEKQNLPVLYFTDNGVHLWDHETGDLIARLPHEGYGVAARWNQSGTQIISWADDYTVRIWDVASETEVLRVQHEYGAYRTGVTAAVWNADESEVLSWTYDGDLRLWDARSGDVIWSLGQSDAMLGLDQVVWNDDETQIFSVDYASCKIWDVSTGEMVAQVGHYAAVKGGEWSDDGRRILSWGFDTSVRIWSQPSQGGPASYHHTSNEFYADSVRLNHDQTLLLSVSAGEVIAWNIALNQVQVRFDNDWVSDVVWKPGTNQFVGWGEGRVVIWDADSGDVLAELAHDPDETIYGVAWSDDLELLMAWGTNDEIWVWDIGTGAVMTRLVHSELIPEPRDDGLPVIDGDHVLGALWSADKTQIVSWGRDGHIWLWDLAESTETPRFVVQHEIGQYLGMYGAALDEARQRLWSWGDKSLTVWDATNGAMLWQIKPVDEEFSEIVDVRWNADRSQALVASTEGVQIVDAASGEVLRNWPLAYAGGADWNPDGDQVMGWAEDEVVIWDVATGETVMTIPEPGEVDGALWHSTGQKLVTWGETESVVRVWAVQTGELLIELPYEEYLEGVRLVGGGDLVLTWTTQGNIRVQYTALVDFIQLGQQRLVHQLDAEQRLAFNMTVAQQ